MTPYLTFGKQGVINADNNSGAINILAGTPYHSRIAHTRINIAAASARVTNCSALNAP